MRLVGVRLVGLSSVAARFGAVSLLALASSACATRTAEPPAEPSRQAQQEERAKGRNRVPHVAPPPAYGNKVVFTDTTVASEERPLTESL